MSKRSLKRRIADILAKRDQLGRVLDAYTTVIYDHKRTATRTDALDARVAELTQMRDELQATAERLATDVPGNKSTYSGLWLHDRRPF